MSHECTSSGEFLAGPAARGRGRRAASGALILVALACAASALCAPLARAAAAPAASGVASQVLCSGYQECASLGYGNHGYAARGDVSYWRMAAGDECTNYAAYVEATVYRAPAPDYLLGNAGQWAATAAAHGVTVNDVPSVGAVAEWDGGAYGMGPEGHVAVVEAVGPDDSYLLISQQHISSDTDGYDWTRINAGYPADSWQEWPDHFIHFAVRNADSVGYYNSRTAMFSLRDSLSAAPTAITFRLGLPGMVPLTGDWTAHRPGSGYYDPANGTFHLRDGLASGHLFQTVTFGPPGMIPLTGDWAGTGSDSIGYYNPQDGSFRLRSALGASAASYSLAFGPPDMIPLTGDWAGTGSDSIGYYNPRTARFTLRAGLRGQPRAYSFSFGPPGMVPVVGRWTGGVGSDVGYYNPRTGKFVLRDGLSRGRPGFAFRFGPRGMTPLSGDWLG